MEKLFYKVKLKNGRVVGPFDLERIKLFIMKEKITGLETARLYPTGEWKNISAYSEIAALLMQKLEGKLTLEGKPTDESDKELESALAQSDETPAADLPPEVPRNSTQTGTPQLQLPEGSLGNGGGTQASPPPEEEREEATVIITSDDEHTVMLPSPGASSELLLQGKTVDDKPVFSSDDLPAIGIAAEEDLQLPDPRLAGEKTAMLTRAPTEKEAKANAFAEHRKKLVSLLILFFAGVYALMSLEPDKPNPEDQEENAPFQVVVPTPELKQDPQKSERLFKSALPIYYQDTVEGYKKAANIFLKAANWDSSNVRALCLLASSYMNLIDVVNRDEVYFNTVTRIIEMERAKNLDLAETVIADVELYLILGNPDAAFTRIVEYAKTHDWGVDLLYYLALTFYEKGNYAEALQKLNSIDPKDIFSPKIYYLYGLIYEKNGDSETAAKAFEATVAKSPKHVKARVKLAGTYFSKDNLPEAGKHADFVILNKSLASRSELSKAYYYRSRMHMVAKADSKAIADLEEARKLTPDDQDILLDYYTLKARQPAASKDGNGRAVVLKDAPAVAKMFNFMAMGERALKEENLNDALAQFLSARQAYEKDPTPLLRIADVFIKKGDLQSALPNFEKALKISPKRADVYPKYIRTLGMAYEFTEAENVMTKFKELQPDPALVDRLQGELYLRQERYVEANTFLKKSLGVSNYDSSVYTAYASLMFKTNNFRDSAFYYGLALRFDPFNAEAVIGIGKSLAELDSVERGTQYVQNALQLSPHKAALLNGIAEIYARKGNYDNALRYADNALTTDSKYALAFKTKGEVYAAKEKRKEALDAYLSYTNLAPLDPTGHIERHKLFLAKDEKGRYDLNAAKLELLNVIKAYPHYPGIHYMLGELFLTAGDAQKAVEHAQDEMKNNPGYLQAYVLAARVYNGSDHCSDADKVITKVIKIVPNYVPALIEAGIAKHCLKAYPAALSMLERAKSLDPGNPAIYMKLGKLYFDLSNHDQMKASFKKYLEVYPDAPDRKEVEEYLSKVQ